MITYCLTLDRIKRLFFDLANQDYLLGLIYFFSINNGNMTEQIPIRSVIIRVTDKSDDCEAECDLSSKSMITDPIRRHKVLLATIMTIKNSEKKF